MKIEIGESLISSWLKHIKECQVVQTNWKASGKWELRNKETLDQLMQTSNDLFSQKYGDKIYNRPNCRSTWISCLIDKIISQPVCYNINLKALLLCTYISD